MLLYVPCTAVMDDYQGSAVLMHTSAQLMALLPSQGPKQLKLQKTAYALAAAAGLQVHEAMPQHAGGQGGCVACMRLPSCVPAAACLSRGEKTQTTCHAAKHPLTAG